MSFGKRGSAAPAAKWISQSAALAREVEAMPDVTSHRQQKAADPAKARNRRRMLLAALLAGVTYVAVMQPEQFERFTYKAATLSTDLGIGLPRLGSLDFSSVNAPTAMAPVSVPSATSVSVPAVTAGAGSPGAGAAPTKPTLGLEAFWAKQAAPAAGESDFAVRIGTVDAGGKRDQVWVRDLLRQGQTVTGVVADGSTSGSFATGARVEFDAASVTAWTLKAGGVPVGGEIRLRPPGA